MKILHLTSAAAPERQQRTVAVVEEQQKRKLAAGTVAEQERQKQAAALAAEQERQKQAAALAAEQERQKQASALAAEQERQKQAAALATEQERQKLREELKQQTEAAAVEQRKQSANSGAAFAAAQEKQRLAVESERSVAVERLLQHVISCRAQVGQLAAQLLAGGGAVAVLGADAEAALVRDMQRLDQLLSDCAATKQAGAPGVVGMLNSASDQVKVLRDTIAQRLASRRTSTDGAAAAAANRSQAKSYQPPEATPGTAATSAAAPSTQAARQLFASADVSAEVARSPAVQDRLVAPYAADDDLVRNPAPPAGTDPGLWRVHCRQQRLLANTKEAAAELRSNTQLKKLRMDLQMVINTTVNAISDASARHMRDKLDKLALLLAGEKVKIPAGTRHVSAREHPAAMPFCMDLLAAKFVEQGCTQVKSKHESAFAFAAVAAGLVRRHADFGELLQAHFMRACPQLVPCLDGSAAVGSGSRSEPGAGAVAGRPAPPVAAGTSGSSDGSRAAEEHHDWLASVSGYGRLYFATFVVSLGDVSRAWTWLAAALRLQPVPYLTATVVTDMLDVTGHMLQHTYGSQFQKLTRLLADDYLQAVRTVDVSVPGAAGPTSRLELLLRAAGRSRWQPPAGLLPPSLRLN